MSKRYRRKKYNDDYLDLIGIAILGVITYIIKFIINNWKIIIYTAITIIIVIILIMNRKKIKEIYEHYYMKKLKKKGQLYLNIEKINNKYNLYELNNFIDYYNISNKSGLESCNIDDYLMMTINDKYDKLLEYKKKYDELTHIYSIYLKEYDELKKYINGEDAKEIKISIKKYNKYQNKIFEENKIK